MQAPNRVVKEDYKEMSTALLAFQHNPILLRHTLAPFSIVAGVQKEGQVFVPPVPCYWLPTLAERLKGTTEKVAHEA